MARSSVHYRFIPDTDSVYRDKGGVSAHHNVGTEGISVSLTYIIFSANNTGGGEVSGSYGRDVTTPGETRSSVTFFPHNYMNYSRPTAANCASLTHVTQSVTPPRRSSIDPCKQRASQ